VSLKQWQWHRRMPVALNSEVAFGFPRGCGLASALPSQRCDFDPESDLTKLSTKMSLPLVVQGADLHHSQTTWQVARELSVEPILISTLPSEMKQRTRTFVCTLLALFPFACLALASISPGTDTTSGLSTRRNRDEPIPITVLSGFLGAGKTNLVRRQSSPFLLRGS
jgi:hypothetical protein